MFYPYSLFNNPSFNFAAMLKKIDLDTLNAMSKNTMMEHLDIKCVEMGDDYIIATMPVDHRTHQPMGLLHGGASAALIESIGSMGSSLLLDLEKEVPVGIEINANHVGGMKSGTAKAIGKVVHAGKRTHVWQVDVFNESDDSLICTGRLTVMIVPRK
jgi:1,4-dihydroxy-2-naphthoyl-CoA hydrolase